MKRIAIIGSAGSGKTTLALQLGTYTGLPVYHLDQYYWKPAWQRPELPAFQKMHDRLCDQDSWIMEGMYTSTLPYRVQRAECVIFLDVPRFVCLWRVIKRIFFNHNQVLPTSAPECRERFDWRCIEFFGWIWNFKARSRPAVLQMLELYKQEIPIYIIKTTVDVDFLFSQLNTGKHNDYVSRF